MLFPSIFPKESLTVAVVVRAGGRGGEGVQRGWLCEGGYRAPHGCFCARVSYEDKPHITWHPAGDPDQGGEKPGPHSGQGQGSETDYWAYLVCTVSTYLQMYFSWATGVTRPFIVPLLLTQYTNIGYDFIVQLKRWQYVSYQTEISHTN